mgnify:FL=1
MTTDKVVCNLYQVRTNLGYTQQQIAKETDIHVRTIINIEKGRTTPSLLYAMKIAYFLNTPVEQLFEYKNDPDI